ncbi:MAG TPA: hypothetical protein PKA13_22230 [Geminicoccaceae bacterium]|nr:hypothetical protein [Geminicoccus sp.]HMU52511.1 hypothetical protein [Geminicoccaceae bacterium]
MFDTTVSTCGTANCSSIVVGATLAGNGLSAGPWTAEIFGGANECLRLDVVAQTVDLEIVAIAPNGTVFRNDDRPGSLLPLVKINGAQNGWYTVSVSQFAGAISDSNFNFAFGRYNLNNANCATPTTPAMAPATATLSKAGLSAGPAVMGLPASP